MLPSGLSFNTRKALCVHVGQTAGQELADLLQHMATRIDELERNKADEPFADTLPMVAQSPSAFLQRAA